MTDIEMKALALWGPGVTAEVSLHNFSILGTAFLEMRERYEAFRQDVSDEIMRRWPHGRAPDGFGRFIIAKPDPLAEAMTEAFSDSGAWEPCNTADADALREAIAKRGGKIVWENEQ